MTITKTTKFKFLIAVILLCALPVFGNFQNQQKRSKVPHYSIISKFRSAGSLTILIFTEEKNIEANQLRSLLQHFFKKYQKPEDVFIHIYTHQSQLRDLGKIEVLEPNDEAERHPYALIARVDGTERINLFLPGYHMQTIIVKEGDESKKQ